MIRSLILLLLMACGKPIEGEKERSFTSPLLAGVAEEIFLNLSMSKNFDLLPLSGSVTKGEEFWTGDSWRLIKGSINQRWYSPTQIGFNYSSPHPSLLKKMTLNELKALSPAEKFDLWRGRYHYPLKRVVEEEALSGKENWEGLCHGWAGASMNHPEPAPIRAMNPDGILIPFGSSDLKALLSYAYSRAVVLEGDDLGKRCDDDSPDSCDEDLSPAALHIVLTNKLGLRGQSIIADIDRYQEVWNHPIIDFESTVKRIQKKDMKRIVTLSTSLTFVDVSELNSWEKTKPILGKMTVEYDLTLDPAGNIIGGRWLGRDRPDFLWTVGKMEKFTGLMEHLEILLK